MEDRHELDEQSQFIMKDEQSQDVAKIIKKRLMTFREKRREMLIEIQANIAYLVGEQNIRRVGDTIIPLDKERMINSIANVLLPAVQKDIAVATQIPPLYDIVPAGTDADDKATAIAGEKIFETLQRKIGRSLKRGETVMWYDIAGIGWRKTYYNPNKYVMGINPAPTDEQGQENPAHIPDLEVGAAIMEGEVEIDSIPPNQLVWDYRETDLDKLEWIIHAKEVTAQYVADTFGPEVSSKLNSKFSTSGDESQFQASINNRFYTMFSGTDDTEQTVHTQKQDSSDQMELDADRFIDYYEYWQKPTKTAPAGMIAVMLGDQVVHHDVYPIKDYPHGELPFTPTAPMAISGVMSGAISRISQARPLQRELNRLRSQIGENIDIMGNAVIMAPRTARLRYRTLSNGAGNIIEYDGPTGKPTREQGIPMNGQIFQYLYETKLAIDSIFAFHEPSQGRAPKNIDSGKGIIALQNQDTLHMGPIVSSFEISDERVVYQALSLALANYPQGKLLNVVGTDYEWCLFELDKDQLNGKFNVMVRPQSSMPMDKAGEAQQAFGVWQSGLIGDPNDPAIRLYTMQQMQMGNINNLLQKHSKQKNFARMEFTAALENLKGFEMPQGLSDEQMAKEIEAYTFIPPINVFDDHMIHVPDHNEYLIDHWWTFKRTGNPLFLELLNNMVIHIQEHSNRVLQVQSMQAQQQIQSQMLIKGKTMEQLTAVEMIRAEVDLRIAEINKNKKGSE